MTRFKENRSKKFFEIWHEGRGLLVGKSDVGGFLSKTQIFPKFRICLKIDQFVHAMTHVVLFVDETSRLFFTQLPRVGN